MKRFSYLSFPIATLLFAYCSFISMQAAAPVTEENVVAWWRKHHDLPIYPGAHAYSIGTNPEQSCIWTKDNVRHVDHWYQDALIRANWNHWELWKNTGLDDNGHPLPYPQFTYLLTDGATEIIMLSINGNDRDATFIDFSICPFEKWWIGTHIQLYRCLKVSGGHSKITNVNL
jgi:hypothetical protein